MLYEGGRARAYFFIGSRAAGFFRTPLYKENTAKNEKSRTKKRLPLTGKSGQPQTHPNTRRSVSGVYGYHTTSRGALQESKERKSDYEQRRSKARNPAQSEDNRLFGKEQRRLVLLPFLRERSRNTQDRRSQILSRYKYYLLFRGLR